jgi:hypothetical protein
MSQAVQELRTRFPHAPFLTLGQTVLWDEPVKAAFCRVLEELAPDAQIVAAVHDTDYFAKLSHFETEAASDRKFLLLPHNDGDTRDLWSAAGEISCLFGSETVPTRHKLVESGVAFERVARDYPGGTTALLNNETNAWGWRALVHTAPRPLLAGEVLVREIAPALLEQLHWAFEESLRCLGAAPHAHSEARAVAARIVRWIEEYSVANPEATLSELYRYLTPRLWALVRGGGSCNLQTSHSLKLFRFNRETVSYPRFRFLDIFLNPRTREIAKRCYDDAVRGSGIYALDQFGAGALPFDVVIPGKGRGTLRLHENSILIETEPATVICRDCDITSAAQLATVLEDKFGAEVVVVGKAVSLISMLAHELIFVFHEKASGYTRLTQKLNDSLRAQGIELQLHPLLRIEYSTWDALAEVEASFTWPPHLANAFGEASTPAHEVAARWREVCEAQDVVREQLASCRAPRELMQLFAQGDADWQAKLSEYSRARELIANLSHEARRLQAQSAELYHESKRQRAAAVQVERAKGEDFRANLLPLLRRIGDIKETAFARSNERDENGAPHKLSKVERQERSALEAREEEEVRALRARIEELEVVRAHFDEEIVAHRAAGRAAQEQARVLIAQRVTMEKSDDAQNARATISQREYEAELEKLRRVRDAMSASESLRHTNLRPTAWWFPLVSPDGVWREALVHSARARLEEI